MQKSRPRSIQKATRSSSIFTSWRSQTQIDEDEDGLSRTSSQPSSINLYSELLSTLTSAQVLLHGDVQTSSSVFRKKSQYLVLTDTHLVKVRSQSRASEVFPCIPSSMGRASGARHSRLSSNGSIHELHTQGDPLHAIPLNQIVAAYRLDDGKPFFSVELAYLDEDVMQASTLVLQLHDPKDHELWLSSIRGAAMNARLKDPLPFCQQLLEYTARTLEQAMDYDPHQLHMFRVVQRAKRSSGARSSSDDLTKLTSNVCILAIGVFRIHLIPLPRNTRTLSSTSLSDMGNIAHGLASLTEFAVAQDDDAFALRFRIPLRQCVSISLASSCINDIALSIRRTAEFLRPKWPEQPFTWNVPKVMDEDSLPIAPIHEDHEALNRTLAAYCAAYGLDASLIRYTVVPSYDDGPVFSLAPRLDGRKYTVLDLLAILRALRYNESFGSLSFAGINLDDLQRLKDPFGFEHVAWRTRSGEQLKQDEEKNSTLLVQEVRALALNSVSLRRLDFSDCLRLKSPSQISKEEDVGCGICEGLFPMCARNATNIDWVNLSGILLSETDIDYLFSTAIDRSCHFRAIDVGRCGLSERGMHTVLNALTYQSATLESLDLSGNPARLEAQSFNLDLLSFSFLRRINLSNISRTSKSDPLITAEVLINWKLEEVDLSKTPLNEESVDALAVYLQSPKSSSLRSLNLDQCQISGHDAATLFEASKSSTVPVRELRINISSNRLVNGHEAFVDIIRQSRCPSEVVMQMIDYNDERLFRQLLDALSVNTSINYLDLSKTTLPSDATQATCESLGRIFAFNSALTYLDISGEQTHLVASNLGPGLNSALVGLQHNSSIQILRIENQRLGLQGANTLATVLGGNKTLKELHCENNEINLQAFTVLVNSLACNETILYLPEMMMDRAWTQQKIDREVDSLRENSNSGTGPVSSTKATVKRTLGRTMTGQKSNHQRTSSGSMAAADLEAALVSLSGRWEKEAARLQEYLSRNFRLAHGLPLEAPGTLALDRPGSAGSLETAMRDFSLEKTPKTEFNRQLGEVGKEDEGAVVEGSDQEDAESMLEMSHR